MSSLAGLHAPRLLVGSKSEKLTVHLLYFTFLALTLYSQISLGQGCYSDTTQAYQVIDVGGDKSLSDVAIIDDEETFEFSINVDGNLYELIPISTRVGWTFSEFIEAFNQIINPFGASIHMDGGNLVVKSRSSSFDSYIEVTNAIYFRAQISGFIGFESPVTNKLKSDRGECTIDSAPTPNAPEIPTPNPNIDKVEVLPGSFKVMPSGQASYNIPIFIAQGVAGFQPSISLRYKSGSRNGIAGIGWSIAGLSSISRCRQTHGQDRNALPISWSSSDRFCLNGQRLVLDLGNYGAPGSTYKTEIDTYSRITAIGGTTGNPQYFKVERKDGITEEYKTRELISNGSNTNILIWKMDSQYDSAGNEVAYSYRNLAGYEQVVDTVSWANGAASLKFNYTDRPDPATSYIAGYKRVVTKRLAEIVSSNDGEVVKRYKLVYGDDLEEDESISRLMTVEACDSTGWKCPQFSRFEWMHASNTPFAGDMDTPILDHSQFSNGFYGHAVGDVNGDGIMDLAYVMAVPGCNIQTFGINYALGSVTIDNGISHYHLTETAYDGGGCIPISSINSDPTYYMSFIDYNGDGRQDLVVHPYTHSMPSRIYLSKPQPDGTWKLSSQAAVEGSWAGTYNIFVDINGDGLHDIMRLSGGGVRFLRKKEGAPAEMPYEYTEEFPVDIEAPSGVHLCEGNGTFSGEVRRETGDFNGDGRLDFILRIPICEGTVKRYEYHLFTSYVISGHNRLLLKHFAQLSQDDVGDNGKVRVIDINGDGFSDVAFGGGAIDKFRISNGARLLLEKSTSAATNDKTTFADINGDGFADAITSVHDMNQAKVVFWDNLSGNFLGPEVTKTIPWQVSAHDAVIYRDLNTDGKIDVMVVGTTYGSWGRVYAGLRKYGNQPENKIYQITDNLYNRIDISYEPIFGSDHYSYIKGVKADAEENICESSTCWNRRMYESSGSRFYKDIPESVAL